VAPQTAARRTSAPHGAADTADAAVGEPPVVRQANSAAGLRSCEYRYRVVPFIGSMSSGSFAAGDASTVTAQLQQLIDQEARQGWDFYSLEKVNIQVNPGCIGQLFGQSASLITVDQVIFRQRI
jgi:hypothetical protein